MAMPRLSTFEDYDEELQKWLERLQMVDALLRGPAETLVRIVKKGLDTEASTFTVPVTLDPSDSREGSFFLRAACSSTIQRLAHRRRRFSWLDDQAIRELGEQSHTPFIALSEKRDHDPLKLYERLGNEPLGATSPLTSAEIFWVLIKAGEKHAHGSLGFFCIFNMLWALKERRDITGRSPGPKGCPTAFVAAKCLLPLRTLTEILRKRARLYRTIGGLAKDLQKAARGSTPRDRWLVVSGLERLASALYEFSTVATDPKEYSSAAAKVTLLADLFTTDKPDPQHRWTTVRGYLVRLLRNSATINEELLGTAATLLEALAPLLPREQPAGEEEEPNTPEKTALDLVGLTASEWEHTSAALASAHWSCGKFLRILQSGVETVKTNLASWPTELPSSEVVEQTLRELADVNEKVAEAIEGSVEGNTYSMRRIITREVAAASAGDRTNFDAAELTAALAIVERWLRISDLEIHDALKWSVFGANSDGSWTSRHPVAMAAGAAELWPGSSEIGWMLTMAVERKSRLRTADDALWSYVQWLDRTRVDMPRGSAASGWPSEARTAEVIDVAATMSAVNALLSIRDLVEERLWELCQKRFVVKAQTKSIFDIDPVDLGARHDKRLHRRLMRMARETGGDEYEKAEYSLVLHGPPGSSKSALAEAVAGDMFRRRLVRVTPADFIRQGEPGLDAEARFIFSLLSHIRGAVIVFDEVDDLLRKRQPDGSMSFLRLVVPAMLNRLQDLRDAAPHQEICFFFATNYVDAIEPALTRPGRFDATLPVPYPDAWSRENILLRNMEKAERANPDYKLLVDRSQQAALITETRGWPWSTFNKMCRELTMRPAGTAKDIELQLERHKGSLENALAYYERRNRWTERSAALEMEVVHAVFTSLSLGDAVGRLEKFTAIIDKPDLREALEEQLRNEWKNTYHPEKWEHAPTRPRFEVTGSPKPMGVTWTGNEATFRVWAPFALQAAVAGDFNGWTPRHEMERVRELPGVWEITLDEAASAALLNPPRDSSIAGQYRYVFTTATGKEDHWKPDPCCREWYLRGGYQNSVAVGRGAVTRPAAVPAAELIGCRISLEQMTFEDIAATAETLRDLGFNLIEIVPALDWQKDYERGLDLRLPYALRTDESRKLRDAATRLANAGMQLVLGTPWGYGDLTDQHPLAHFDGWSSAGYQYGIYFRGDGKTLDLDEPQICNVIFDHACELTDLLGLRGVHLLFDERITAQQNLQATSLAHHLAGARGDGAQVWVDSTLDLTRIPSARPLVCAHAATHLMPRQKSTTETEPAFSRFKTAGTAIQHVAVVTPDRPNRGADAAAAFTLPTIPIVTYSDALVNIADPWSRVVAALIAMRRELQVSLLSTAVDPQTNPDKPHMPSFRRCGDGREIVVVLNLSDHEQAAEVPEGTWSVRLSTDTGENRDETVSGRAVMVAPQSARILDRRTGHSAPPR